jgi:hypothetical protein
MTDIMAGDTNNERRASTIRKEEDLLALWGGLFVRDCLHGGRISVKQRRQDMCHEM